MSESLALILIFGGIAWLVVVLVAVSLVQIAGEHRSNLEQLRRHGHA